ncbi:MAG: DNA polymerase III subunit delta [Bacteroidales bacterium]|nr:DNA polymerase III subunit delta [Bacteroidales bacterium]
MAASTYEEIMRDISAKKFSPIYFLYGTEPYFIDSVASEIERTALDEDMKVWNQIIVYGKDVLPDQIVIEAGQYPTMGDRRVVIVREAQDMDSKPKGDVEALIPYCDAKLMQPSTILVVCVKLPEDKGNHKTLYSKTAKFATAVQKAGGVTLETKRLYDNQVVGWINNYVASQRITIDVNAAEMLAEFVGVDISNIVASIEKLKVAVGGKLSHITADIVQENIGLSKEYNTFELKSALMTRNVAKVNRIVKAFSLNPKQHQIIPIIANLFPVFRKVLIYHYSKNLPMAEILKAVEERSEWSMRENVLRPASFYNPQQCYRALLLLEQYDMRAKGLNYPSVQDGDLLRELVFRIMNC